VQRPIAIAVKVEHDGEALVERNMRAGSRPEVKRHDEPRKVGSARWEAGGAPKSGDFFGGDVRILLFPARLAERHFAGGAEVFDLVEGGLFFTHLTTPWVCSAWLALGEC